MVKSSMKREFSIAHLTLLNYSPSDLTYIAARAGYDLVSFRSIPMGLPHEPNHSLSRDRDLFRRTQKALTETGIRLLDIEVVLIKEGVDQKAYLKDLEVGAELGATCVIAGVWTPDRQLAYESFAQICELARPFGMSVNIEIVTWSGAANLQEALDIVRGSGAENGGILVDTLHFHRSRVTLEELEAAPKKMFNFIHLADAPPEIPAETQALIHTARNERLYPGEGGIDIAAILNRLPGLPCSLEVPHNMRLKELGAEEHARRMLQSTKEYLAGEYLSGK